MNCFDSLLRFLTNKITQDVKIDDLITVIETKSREEPQSDICVKHYQKIV